MGRGAVVRKGRRAYDWGSQWKISSHGVKALAGLLGRIRWLRSIKTFGVSGYRPALGADPPPSCSFGGSCRRRCSLGRRK